MIILLIILLLFTGCVSTQPEAPILEKEGIWQADDGTDIFYFIEGQGRHVVVVHGGPGIPPENPWPALSRLAGKYTFVYYHQRGSGKSGRPVDKFQTNNFMQNMTKLDKVLGIDRQLKDIDFIRQQTGDEKLILIGHSYGGFLATLFALKYPGKIEKLVLLAPAEVLVMPVESGGLYGIVGDLLKDDPLSGEYADYLSRFFDYGSIFTHNETYLSDLNAEFIRYWERASRIAGNVTFVPGIEKSLIGGWMPHALYLSLGQRYDYRPKLKNITVPVLVIHGSKDIIPPESSSEYIDNIKGSRLAIIEGAGHFLYEDAPEECGTLIAQFLQ